MKDICIVGSGHIGLVTGACLADLGNRVICMDNDVKRVESLKSGTVPFYEPDLEEIVLRNMRDGRLSFTSSVEEAARLSEIVFVCVGTPSKPDGEPDVTAVERAVKSVVKAAHGYKLIVEKSTVPVKTGSWIKRITELNMSAASHFDVASNPEFLREGRAVYDFMHPDRIVIGTDSERAANTLVELYQSLGSPIVLTDIETSELIKHASNAFLAMKVSYINAVADICEKVGADVAKVAEGMGYDRRIGREFLDAGIGYGGYCLPKDAAAFVKIAEGIGYHFRLLEEVQKINADHRHQMVRKAKSLLWNLSGKTIGILGLSFKPGTDDMRDAPSIDIIRELQREGATIRAYDPKAMGNAKEIVENVQFCGDPYQLAEGSDALIIVTEWDEFKSLDLTRIKELLSQPVVIDGRNIFDPKEMRQRGFIYEGVGR